MMPSTSPRSSPARSLSLVLRAASSNAKFGAAENACGFWASALTQRDGFSRNATGLVNFAGWPPRIGAHTPSTNPMSW